MNTNEIIKFLIWYGYKDVHFEKKINNRSYFRCKDWFVFIIIGENSIEIQQAKEDFYEYYPIDSDMYDFTFESEFNLDEIYELIAEMEEPI